jgi:tetratricopeptide (TPR) repeat protein
VKGWVPVAIFTCAVLPVLALDPAPDQAEVCAEVEAYSYRLAKAERKQREQEARHDARVGMIEQVWNEAFERSSLPVPTSSSERTMLQASYGVAERIAGGRFVRIGNKKMMILAYCLPVPDYEAAREALRAKRATVYESFRHRFAGLESQIELGEMETASREFAALRVDVVTEALSSADYHSELQDRTRTFNVWLLEWGDVVPRDPGLVRELTAHAETLLERGRLDEADRYVNEALEIERTAETLELRARIQKQRNIQAELALKAEELAEARRYRAAEARLDEAREQGATEAYDLEDTARTIDGLRAADRAHNPPRRVVLFAALGTLGVDSDLIERRVAEDTGLDVSASLPLSIGAGGHFRIGRKLQVGFTGSFGVAQTDQSLAGEPLSLYDLYQLTASASYATRRNDRRSISWQFGGGVVWERVDVNKTFTATFDDTSEQTAFFFRFGADWKHLSLYVQHGFGFEDEPGNALAGWGNNFQLGVGGTF